MSREFLLIVQESAWKTPVTTPTIWTTGTTYGLANYGGAYIRLDGDNSFTPRSEPTGIVEVPYGGGVDVPAYKFSDKQMVQGTLKCRLTVGLAPMLLSWLGVRINGAQTAPWTTTRAVGDLVSCSVYHGRTRSDNTIDRKVYLGTMCESGTLTTSEDSTDVTLSLNLVGGLVQSNPFDGSTDPTSGTFPAPADNNLAVDPFVFIHSGGANYFTYGGAVRTQFSELNLSIQNKLARKYYANRYIQTIQWVGRTTTLASKIAYPPAATADQANFQQLSSAACSLEINNGTHGFTIGMNAQNVLNPLKDDLPLANIYMQSSTSNNMWDATAGSDFTITFT